MTNIFIKYYYHLKLSIRYKINSLKDIIYNIFIKSKTEIINDIENQLKPNKHD